MSTKKQEKQLSMRQQLRAKAQGDLVEIKMEAARSMDRIAGEHGLNTMDLIKAISGGNHKTAEHMLVTQLANRYEADVLRIWNDQQPLPLGKSDGDE